MSPYRSNSPPPDDRTYPAPEDTLKDVELTLARARLRIRLSILISLLSIAVSIASMVLAR